MIVMEKSHGPDVTVDQDTAPNAEVAVSKDPFSQLVAIVVDLEKRRNLRARYIEIQYGYVDSEGNDIPPREVDGEPLTDDERERMVMTSTKLPKNYKEIMQSLVAQLENSPEHLSLIHI